MSTPVVGSRARMSLPEPAVVGEGCVRCGKPRRPERSRRYAGCQAELDAFCSRLCCEAWFGIVGKGVGTEEDG